MENNIYCKPAYKCGICGTEHQNVLDRARCEISCTEAQKKEVQTTRKAEVDAAFENLHKLITEYVKDYGHYEYSDGGEDTNFYWPTRLWHRFW